MSAARLLSATRHCAGAALALALLAGCRPNLPDDPQERLEAIQELVQSAPTSYQASIWLGYLVDDVRPETRDYLFSLLENSRHMLARETVATLAHDGWMADPLVRAKLIEFYSDTNRSNFIRFQIACYILKYRDIYPDLAALPRDPVNRTDVVHVVRP